MPDLVLWRHGPEHKVRAAAPLSAYQDLMIAELPGIYNSCGQTVVRDRDRRTDRQTDR